MSAPEKHHESGHPGVYLGDKFRYGEVNYGADPTPPSVPGVPLGVLDKFEGRFHGPGFNNIFRPRTTSAATTKYPDPFANPNAPQPPPTAPNPSVLELNLTHEVLSFSKPLGEVPNRGLNGQADIFLNGVTYLQVVYDVTNTETGKGDGKKQGIHTETGFWLNVPSTDSNPVLGDTLVRIGSIPHGTTINAQGAPPDVTYARPAISRRSINPFTINEPGTAKAKDSQTVTAQDTPRLPQDLTKFIHQGTITQRYLDDPSKILLDINKQLNITETRTFTVSTQTDPALPAAAGQPPNPTIPGSGTANIAFLVGGDASSSSSGTAPGPNANAVQMTATFWVETITTEITLPACAAGATVSGLVPSHLVVEGSVSPPPLPEFSVTVAKAVTEPTQVPVTYTQIQYEQIVLLNFHTLSWPHLSLATLVPADPIKITYPATS